MALRFQFDKGEHCSVFAGVNGIDIQQQTTRTE